MLPPQSPPGSGLSAGLEAPEFLGDHSLVSQSVESDSTSCILCTQFLCRKKVQAAPVKARVGMLWAQGQPILSLTGSQQDME